MLTQKQRDLLILIHERMRMGDIAPSFDEMKDLLKLKSKSGIHRLITGLVDRGYLARLPYKARALEVRRLPEGYDGSGPRAAAPSSRASGRGGGEAHSVAALSIPLMGKIAAGTAIEAIRHEGHHIDIPPSLIGKGDHYALTVEGDSMIDAGIHNGDTVIIRRADRAEQGQIVVALIDDSEVTLKRLRRKDGSVVLQAENPAYDDRVLPANRVKVQGILASLVRTYH